MARGKPPKKPFPKGSANPGSRKRRKETGAGRAPGTANKITTDIKLHLLNALNDPRVGGEEWFVTLALKDWRTMGGLVRAIVPQKIQTGPDPEETATKIREQMLPDMDAATQSKPKEEKKK